MLISIGRTKISDHTPQVQRKVERSSKRVDWAERLEKAAKVGLNEVCDAFIWPLGVCLQLAKDTPGHYGHFMLCANKQMVMH